MSLFEWFGEAYNPGPIGGVSFSEDYEIENHGTKGIILLKLVLALVIIAIGYYLVFTKIWILTLGNFIKTNLLVYIYLALALFITPQPDYSNIGWLGGIFDHPFRYSDDINRFLIFLVILLYPGKFIVRSLVLGVFLLSGRN